MLDAPYQSPEVRGAARVVLQYNWATRYGHDPVKLGVSDVDAMLSTIESGVTFD
jgi:hypothetical protein